jgi:hypothetical protein
MRRKQLINDIRAFAQWAKNKLGIQSPVKIRLRGSRMQNAEQSSFGGYDLTTGLITVSTSGRHLMDVMRTIAHEMCHQRQHELKPLSSEDGITGSDAENQANAIAGILMREWAIKSEA